VTLPELHQGANSLPHIQSPRVSLP
jgi:hypothetical protein